MNQPFLATWDVGKRARGSARGAAGGGDLGVGREPLAEGRGVLEGFFFGRRCYFFLLLGVRNGLWIVRRKDVR